MSFKCPVCDWEGLKENPAKNTYEICEQCGVEFGYEDRERFPAIREAWIAAGQPYWFGSEDCSMRWLDAEKNEEPAETYCKNCSHSLGQHTKGGRPEKYCRHCPCPEWIG